MNIRITMIGFLLSLVTAVTSAQITPPKTPLELKAYTSLTSHFEMTYYLRMLASFNPKMKLDIIGKSEGGRDIYCVRISETEFGADNSKLKVLLFAQQHGDEPSGKEGLLLLLRDVSVGKYDELLKVADVMVVPQVNPDGAELQKRRNGQDADLNRNHLILTQNESAALHHLFNRWLPHVTLDVHEYSPFGKDWIEYGFRKDFDEQFGTLTNPNADADIVECMKNEFLPFIESYLNRRAVSFHQYIVGGPPNIERLRYSTVDINDGRQSLGIRGTFSMILEGKNGIDSLDRIQERSEKQYAAVAGYLEFIQTHHQKIKDMVTNARNHLTNAQFDYVYTQMEHVASDAPLEMNLLDVGDNTMKKTTVYNYHPVVQPLDSVKAPLGYLLPANDSRFKALMRKHYLQSEPADMNKFGKLQQYRISKVTKIEREGEMILFPELLTEEIDAAQIQGNYLFVPLKQLSSKWLMLAFEPQSMIGLVQYPEYNDLLKEGSIYPVIRVH